MPEQFLSEIVHIRSNHLRAVQLEEDLPNGNLLDGYSITAQALEVLGRVVDGLTNQARAWTLTGPFGSGKSFFGLFLAHLLDPRLAGHTAAWEMVTKSDPLLAERLQHTIGKKGGFWAVAVTGARTPLQECLARGFSQVLEAGNFPKELRQELEIARYSNSRVFLQWLKTFIKTASTLRPKMSGVVIIFDEMGKALEHAANHPQESDVYLLQELAEFAAQSTDHPLVFIGILHQAFEGYAAFLDRTTQREWAKVQGRFEDIPFQEPPTQQMRLLAHAIEGQTANKPTQTLSLEEWRPATMSAEEFEALSRDVYPLHPSVFATLPYVFRRLAQNERSIFAYLSSQEPYGFQEFLATRKLGETLRLPDVFDYLAANYQGRIYTSSRARPLTEVLERLENTPSLIKVEQDLLKTIGMLNWLGEISPFRANETLILSALMPAYNEAVLRATLKILQRRSLIVYRRFNETYSIWQGSDVDIEERLQVARKALETTLSVAEILQTYLPPRPLLAHRHSFQTGVQRYFNVRYVDIHNQPNISLTPSSAASGLVLLCLPNTLAEIDRFERWAQSENIANLTNLVIGVTGHAIRLKELVLELRGLHWVRENTPEMRDDPVARREWRTRLSDLEHTLRVELDEAFNLHQISALAGCQWFYNGNEISSQVQRGLSTLLSEICDSLYPNSPLLWNELLNRHDLTSQGAAARRILIEGILTRGNQPMLGIQKFPPERSMYESLLRRGGLHRLEGETWLIVPPPAIDPLNLRPTWDAISEFIFSGLPEPRPLIDLYARISAPPYGVTPGLAPVLLAAFYKVHENELTLYKDGTLLVEPQIADWEVMLRRPEMFSLAGCRVTGLRAAVLERMADSLGVPPQVMPVVRSLIGRMKALPDHAWRTRNLPEIALNLRRAVDMARSPEHFLFVEIPESLNLPPFEVGDFEQDRFDVFFEKLNSALEALANATPRLLAWARDTWLSDCGLPLGEEGWELFRAEAKKMVIRVSNPQLTPLIKRAAETPDSLPALESVLAYIANRPLRAWTDVDTERFNAQAAYLGEMWQVESGNYGIHTLSSELQARSQKVADELQTYLQIVEQDKKVQQTALYALLNRLKE